MSEVRARLAEALHRRQGGARYQWDEVADALLPVVQALIAEELEKAAEEMRWPNSQNCGPDLRARATALRAATTEDVPCETPGCVLPAGSHARCRL